MKQIKGKIKRKYFKPDKLNEILAEAALQKTEEIYDTLEDAEGLMFLVDPKLYKAMTKYYGEGATFLVNGARVIPMNKIPPLKVMAVKVLRMEEVDVKWT